MICGSSAKFHRVAVVVIGRNEGGRLVRCLESVCGQAARVIYVDSGSTDASIDAATRRGCETVSLDMSLPFTAARARNAGLAVLQGENPPEFVQFVDGDCELTDQWIGAAVSFLDSTPEAAVAFGRLREVAPGKSIYNRLCDEEWNLPVGLSDACGGIALMRRGPIVAVGGFNESLIAGEEPELCLRLRREKWQVWRIDAEMGLHDADMTRFDQWWKRSKRNGHAYAEGAAMHGAGPERFNMKQRQRVLFWGAVLPVVIVGGGIVFGPWMYAALLLYAVQWLRLRRRTGWLRATFLVIGKFAEAQGVLGYNWHRLIGGRRGLIEYK